MSSKEPEKRGNIYYYEEVDSTNVRLKELAEAGAEHGTVVLAESQSAGRGRRGRTWESPGGVCVYMSLLLRPDILPEHAPMLTLAMALSAAEAVREETGLPALIKWPNDIIVNKKKVCGILTEMSVRENAVDYVVIGVGINVNQKHFPEGLRKTATSLFLESGQQFGRRRLAETVLGYFETNYGIFRQTEDLSGLLDAYQGLLINRGRRVRILDPQGEYEALAKGIDREGKLTVELDGGEERHIFSGEVSVRGLWDYV